MLKRLSLLIAAIISFGLLSVHQTTLAQGSGALDVVFVVDTTGSMSPFIDGVKSNINTIIDTIAATTSDFQVGVVGYGDPDTQFLLQLTADRTAITNGVNALFAAGGGDTPELTYCGVSRAVEQMSWRGGRRVIILIGDANDKTGCDVAGIPGTSSDTISRANSRSVSICAIPLTSLAEPHFATLASATGCGIYPAATPSELVNAILGIIISVGASPITIPGCQITVPAGSVVGNAPAGARVYWAPDRATEPPITLNPGTYWVIGQDASETYYKIVLACQFRWVRKDTMGPNFDNVWRGTPLPTRIVD